MYPPYRAKIRYTLHGSPVIAYLPAWTGVTTLWSAWSLVATLHRVPMSGSANLASKCGNRGLRDLEVLEVIKSPRFSD